MCESLKDLVERYFNYYPETKSLMDGHEDPYIPLDSRRAGYNKYKMALKGIYF